MCSMILKSQSRHVTARKLLAPCTRAAVAGCCGGPERQRPASGAAISVGPLPTHTCPSSPCSRSHASCSASAWRSGMPPSTLRRQRGPGERGWVGGWGRQRCPECRRWRLAAPAPPPASPIRLSPDCPATHMACVMPVSSVQKADRCGCWSGRQYRWNVVGSRRSVRVSTSTADSSMISWGAGRGTAGQAAVGNAWA